MSIGSSPEPEKIIKKKNDNIKKSENNSKKKKQHIWQLSQQR